MTNATINKYLSKVDRIEGSDTHKMYYIGPSFIVETSTVSHDLKSRHDLMNIWKKSGAIEKKLPTHISVNTYYTDEAGNCWGRYNITVKESDDRKRLVIDFDYMREATPENGRELVAECIRLAAKAGAIA